MKNAQRAIFLILIFPFITVADNYSSAQESGSPFPDDIVILQHSIDDSTQAMVIDERWIDPPERMWYTLFVLRDSLVLYEKNLAEFSNTGAWPLDLNTIGYGDGEKMIALKYFNGGGMGRYFKETYSLLLFMKVDDEYKLVLNTPYEIDTIDGPYLLSIEEKHRFEYIYSDNDGKIGRIRKIPSVYVKKDLAPGIRHAIVVDSVKYIDEAILQKGVMSIENYRWDAEKEKFIRLD